MKYLSPRSDVGFKKLFGSSGQEQLTIDFLNAVLERQAGNLIETVTFADTEQLPEVEEGRKSFFDIYCTDQTGAKFIIEIQIDGCRDEMQRKYQSHFMPRAQYYTALSFYRQMHSPFKYEKLVPVIFIGVLDHILYPDVQDVITRHALMDIKNHTISSHHQMYHIIELPKFTKKIEECTESIDAWLFFMNQADKFEAVPKELARLPKINTAFTVLERMRWTERELDEYIAEADAAGYMDRFIEGAIERGLEEGLKEGLEQGAQKKAEAIAKNLLNIDLAMEQIVQATGFSIEQIKKLKK